jgi:aminomuconate-semialdehyde/2-hydroxymuconate-6-semialdehyde dehydrogenase
MERILNYINGELVEPNSKSYLDNFEPATGKVYGEIPDSNHTDIDQAITAAEAAKDAWAKTSRQDRSDYLIKMANVIESKVDQFVAAESRDNGKPEKLARTVDIPRAVSNLKFFATAILHTESQFHKMDDLAINYTDRKPIGVVGCISPWNLPLYLFTWKIAPALATGNCVIAKPSEVTPMTAYLLSEAAIEAGLPKGVLNIVHGLGAKVGASITEAAGIKAISFTGGTSTGKAIASVAAPMFKKMSLELGGKNPNIIFEDCDFDKALSTTVMSSFANQGQICLCGSRIMVQRSIYEKFRDAFVEKVSKLQVGDPKNEDSNLGAIVSKEHLEKIKYYINLAKEEGGKILTGGKSPVVNGRCEDGYFMRPTIIEGLSYDCRTNQEEIFGPVVTIMPFDTAEDALTYANSTVYGLASTVWTKSLGTAQLMADKIDSGIIWINCWLVRDLRTPFGGMKASGLGREGGNEALRFFTEPKNVCIKL